MFDRISLNHRMLRSRLEHSGQLPLYERALHTHHPLLTTTKHTTHLAETRGCVTSPLTTSPKFSSIEIMHKEELIKHLAKKNRRPQEHYRAALNEILASIQDQLAQGKEIVLTGFGSFYTRTHKGGK